MPKISIPRGSVENLHTPVTADVSLTVAMTVAIAIGRNSDGTYTWLTSEWEGDEATTRTAVTSTPVTFSAANYPLRNYTVYVKVTDTPEVPVIEAGQLVIT
jgi:hypothetical protein